MRPGDADQESSLRADAHRFQHQRSERRSGVLELDLLRQRGPIAPIMGRVRNARRNAVARRSATSLISSLHVAARLSVLFVPPPDRFSCAPFDKGTNSIERHHN